MNNDTSLDINNHSNPVQTVAQPKEDNEMLRATDKITALYCRLSVEDTKDEKKNGKEDLSNSIQNQKAMLLQYARDHRFPHPTFFIDDGYSGVTYDRPGFQKMLDEMEAGHVGVVITKDLSRLGRNSALTGLYINYTFPQNDVRYIAINDHFDSINPNSTDSDIAGRALIHLRGGAEDGVPEQTGVHYPAKSPAAMFAGTPEGLSIKCYASLRRL